MNSLPKQLGCAEDKYDNRDEAFGYVPKIGAVPTFERTYDVEKKLYSPKDDLQDDSLACVNHGIADDVELTYFKHTGIKVHLSPIDLYSQGHSPGGGSSPRNLYKIAHKVGITEYKYLPSNGGTRLTEARARDRSSITTKAIENALKYRIGAYRSIRSYNFNLFAQAIYENNGCGFGIRPIKSGMGHFIFGKAYKIINGLKAIGYRDSYLPIHKWIINKGSNFYLQDGRQVELYSAWTVEPGNNWKKEIPNMPIFLERKESSKPVLMVVNSEPYWFKDKTDFDNFSKEWSDIINWENVKVVKKFSFPYRGKIIGLPNFADIIKNILGLGKK